MAISAAAWVNYVNRLSAVDKKATALVGDFITNFANIGGEPFSFDNPDHMRALINYSYGVSTVYGEAAAALACEMYDAAGLASGMFLEPAVPVSPPGFKGVAASVTDAAKAKNVEIVASRVGRLVKKTGARTTLHNAKRDGLKAAWVPHGDTCAFCIALASRGWEDARELEDNMHIHSNCDCTYAVKYNENTSYAGYDPQTYKDLYYSAPVPEGEKITAKSRINALRREAYAENKEEINAQKRSAYAKRKERESSEAEEINVN